MNAQAQTPATTKPARAAKAPKADKGTKKPAPVKAAKMKTEAKQAKQAKQAVAKPAKAPRTPAPLSGKTTDALREAAKRYHHDKEKKTAGGHVSVDNGDQLATKLRGMDLDGVYAFAAKTLGEDEKALRAKYAHLNPGMQRMNLGNRCRAEMGLTKAGKKAE